MEPVCHFMYMNPSMLLRVLLQKREWFYLINRQAGSHAGTYKHPFVTNLVMLIS